MKKQTYDLEERLLEYSVRIIKIVEQLPKTRVGNHVAGQLLKAGTSPYPNHGEAQAAESPKDFIHKLRISLKELRESQRWLTRIFHELPAATADMTVLPGVLGYRTLRRTVQVRLGSNPLRLPGGTPFSTVSRHQFVKYPG